MIFIFVFHKIFNISKNLQEFPPLKWFKFSYQLVFLIWKIFDNIKWN